MAKRKLPLFTKILIGMVIGLILGFIASETGFSDIITNWIKPFGEIFIRLLKLIAVPLVLVSLIKGIGGLKDISRLASMGIKTMVIYIITTLIAIVVGITLVLTIQPGKIAKSSVVNIESEKYNSSLSANIDNMHKIEDRSPLQPIVDIVPDNITKSMSDNGAMLQIIFIAIIVGIAIILVGEENSTSLMNLVDNINHILLKIIDLVMEFAPIGVMALMAAMITDSAGDISLLGALGTYAITVILALLILMYLIYPLIIKLFTNVKPVAFIRAMLPVQLVALSTSSSAATLPTTLKVTEDVLKLPNNVVSFVLPVGVTINMDGTSCYQAIAVIFIAQVLGIDLSFIQILTIIATTTISSIGTPGIPGGSIVISMMVMSSVGIPPEGLALILGIDRPLDMLRTAVNVTGDATVASIISKSKK